MNVNQRKIFREKFVCLSEKGIDVVAKKFGDGEICWRQEAIEAFIDELMDEQKRLILEEVAEKYGDYRYIGQKRGFGRYEIGRALRFHLLPHTKHKKGDRDNLT